MATTAQLAHYLPMAEQAVADARRFRVGRVAQGPAVTLADMLRDNAEDEGLREWLERAQPGDVFADGEGVVCISVPEAEFEFDFDDDYSRVNLSRILASHHDPAFQAWAAKAQVGDRYSGGARRVR